jgi:hypothetical protein
LQMHQSTRFESAPQVATTCSLDIGGMPRNTGHC